MEPIHLPRAEQPRSSYLDQSASTIRIMTRKSSFLVQENFIDIHLHFFVILVTHAVEDERRILKYLCSSSAYRLCAFNMHAYLICGPVS